MFRWFRPIGTRHQTALAMLDPRPGDELLFMGAANLPLAGEAGAVAGLNGRAVIVDEGAGTAHRVEQAAGRAGALLEFVNAPLAMLPFDTASFNLVVVPNLAAWPADTRAPRIAEAVRVARPGGRVMIVAGQTRGGIFGALGLGQERPPTMKVETVLSLLTAAGTIAARRLAEVDGVAYYESRKPR